MLGGLLIAGILWLASGGSFQKKYTLYLAVMDESVAGLNVNAPVKYYGVDVGKVRSIQLDQDNSQRVNLLLAIDQGTAIKQDTVAVLKTQGLTGIAYVELNGGALDSPLLTATATGKYPVIRTKASLSARLENVLTNVLSKVDTLSSSINQILSPKNQAAFENALEDVATLSRTLASRKDALDSAIIGAAKTFQNTSTITAQLSNQIEPLTARIGRSADAIEKMGLEVAQASNNANITIDAVGTDIKLLSQDTLPELQRLMSELSTLSAVLRHLAEQTQRDPKSLLFGLKPASNGPGETSPKK